MKILLKTLSPLLCATGESSAHIDADFNYDEYGFPYINAKTFKGLLRESAEEVCEMLGQDKVLIDVMFGKTGNAESGSLLFNNLVIKNQKQKHIDLKQNLGISNNTIRNYYTEYRTQTTIENGVARDKSLRTYKLVKSNIEFETTINGQIANLELLENAISNLRYIGSRRNRGFGKVKFKIQQSVNEKALNESIIEYDKNHSTDSNLKKLNFKIKTLNPLIIAKIVGEQNTVSTEKFIPSQNLRGLLAQLILQSEKANIKNGAHNNSVFRNIILSGDINYFPAFKDELMPTPKSYGYEKTEANGPAIMIFSNSNKSLKSISGYSKILNEDLISADIHTSFSFHSSRKDDRLAGRSTELDGGIFYYEAIDANQIFKGQITGPEHYLKYIMGLLNQNNGVHRMGKSKTAQYAEVLFSDYEMQNLQNFSYFEESKTLYLLVLSPIITYNEFGLAIPNIASVETEIKNTLGNHIKVTNVASALEQSETYMGVWKSKTQREAGFGIGTTIEIKSENGFVGSKLEELFLKGIGERKSEGYGKIEILKLEAELRRQKNIAKTEGIGSLDLTKVLDEEILEMYNLNKSNEKYNKIKESAIKAKKPMNFPNTLAVRLLDELNKCKDIASWKQFMSKIKGKKAANTLDRSNLWHSINELRYPEEVENGDYSDRKIYWTTYLKALRVKNKISQKNGN